MGVFFDFTGKKFVVTGAANGIGYQLMLELLEAGATVLAISRHLQKHDALRSRYTGRLFFAEVDVNQHENLEKAVQQFVEENGCVDGSVHSAGQSSMMPLNVWNMEKAQAVMDVNLWAGMALLKILSKKKYSNPGMSHIFISSVSAHKGQKGLSVYSASKGALEAMVRCAAQELAVKKQRVNSVCFGWVETTMTKDSENIVPESLLGKGMPADAAGILLFLLSERATWITGSNFIVDGGFLS